MAYKITVCASGGGGNFQALIDNQQDNGYEINLLISDRQCKAIERATKHQIPYKIIKKNQSDSTLFTNMDQVIPHDTNLIILAGFFPILNTWFCDKWENKIINTHPSLLPNYGGKGMYGIKVQEAVMGAKEEFGGCTVHYVNPVIDGGKIILQKKVKVDYNQSPWELGGRIFKEENKLLVEAVKLIIQHTKGV